MPTRILVGDDSQVVRKTIVTLLRSAGYDVCGEAEDGAQEVKMAKELRPDLIVIDLVMPSMNGFAAARGDLPGSSWRSHRLAYAPLIRPSRS